MRTSQQALQDALDSGAVAAFIAGKSIDMGYSPPDDPHWVANNKMHRPDFCRPDRLWRPTPLSFPAPPEGCSYHNPDNLTPEQVGEGYRLLLVSEIKERDWNESIHKWWSNGWSETRWRGSYKEFTFRVPSSTPFHWDTPKRIPLAPEDFIGAWLKMSDTSHWQVTGVEGVDIHTKRGVYEVDELISREILVRLANTTEFVNCYKEEAV